MVARTPSTKLSKLEQLRKYSRDGETSGKKLTRSRNKKVAALRAMGLEGYMRVKMAERIRYVLKLKIQLYIAPTSKNRRPKSEEAANVNQIIRVVSAAFLNPYVLDCDVSTLKGQQEISTILDNPQLGEISDPCTVVDCKGHILVWYLPGLMPNKYQRNLFHATKILDHIFKRSVDGKNWRRDPQYFYDKTGNLIPGTETFSAGWFPVGHGYSQKAVINTSCSIRLNVNKGTLLWLKQIRGPSEFLNDTLALTHPALYRAGIIAREKLKLMKATREYAELWPSVFSGISPITNCSTKVHCNNFGHYAWYNQLVTMGTYKSAKLCLPELGASLEYGPGTVVHLCGNLLEHAVDDWGVGDRICYAYFFRKDVMTDIPDIPPAVWQKIRELETRVAKFAQDIVEAEAVRDKAVEMNLDTDGKKLSKARLAKLTNSIAGKKAWHCRAQQDLVKARNEARSQQEDVIAPGARLDAETSAVQATAMANYLVDLLNKVADANDTATAEGNEPSSVHNMDVSPTEPQAMAGDPSLIPLIQDTGSKDIYMEEDHFLEIIHNEVTTAPMDIDKIPQDLRAETLTENPMAREEDGESSHLEPKIDDINTEEHEPEVLQAKTEEPMIEASSDGTSEPLEKMSQKSVEDELDMRLIDHDDKTALQDHLKALQPKPRKMAEDATQVTCKKGKNANRKKQGPKYREPDDSDLSEVDFTGDSEEGELSGDNKGKL
ncbi:hypothetical protein NP233_g9828 [Leucocoprinus birnbaumii]|uniref:2OGFeDO JBP1/TET oxygenase domain-containing protein n=1 Tax=Leucocoprinus birnbaumii TaxID=56174 RepID=A0AAD5VLF3_9AGAR|nr:hypothetical protein NP233_g9828 [Leucocoprinus birnbaumii]